MSDMPKPPTAPPELAEPRTTSRSPHHAVIVVGGGHAGCEAALACARLGLPTLLLTGSIDRIAAMSCNPAIGGVGKGHLVRELDALGGEMARVADATGIHFRTLNASRGPAVRAVRCQSDMERYRSTMHNVVMDTEGLLVRQAEVIDLVLEGGAVVGVVTKQGETLMGQTVVLTTGTFLGGQIHRGQSVQPGGRAGEAPAQGLSAALVRGGLTLGRLKTGTCPRLDARTIDWTRLEMQPCERPAPRFAFGAGPPPLRQVSCGITETNAQTHKVIADAIASGACPLFNGQLDGQGPRYCPSLEDKVHRFPDKTTHNIFLEPHGLDTPEVYPNGLSTSMPIEVQMEFLRTIRGLEHVEVTRYGYAVAYDFADPTQLWSTLQTKAVRGLYLAGQINGTTGYEEAAVQGFWAGVNAAHAVMGRPPFVLGRHEAYAGVLVDDLVTKGTNEPYRMFTSRAEHRLVLRYDNAHARLADHAESIGICTEERIARMRADGAAVQNEMLRLRQLRVAKNDAVNAALVAHEVTPIKQAMPAAELAKRQGITAPLLREITAGDDVVVPAEDITERALIEIKYAGYIDRAQKEIERQRALDDEELPPSLFDAQLPGMSNEVYEKLRLVRPRTLAQASRIQGMTPAAVGLLAVALKRAASGG